MLSVYCCLLVFLSVFYEINAVGYCDPRIIRALNQKTPVLLKYLVGHVYFAAMTEMDATDFDRAHLYIAPEYEDMAGANLTTSSGEERENLAVTPIWFIQMNSHLIKGNNYPGAFNVMYDYRPVRCSGEAMLTFICDSELFEGSPTFTITTKEDKVVPQEDLERCVAIARSAAQNHEVEFTLLNLPV